MEIWPAPWDRGIKIKIPWKNWIVLHRMWWLLYIDRCPGAGPKKICPSLFLCILKLTNKKQLPENQMNQPYGTVGTWMHPTLPSYTCKVSGVQLYKNNARVLLLRILNINCQLIQIGCSTRVVYAEYYIMNGIEGTNVINL